MSRPDIKLRMARDEDAETIAKLVLDGTGFGDFDGWTIDWTGSAPWWIVAELDGHVVGAVQFCPSKPIARLEMMGVRNDLGKKIRGTVVDLLHQQGCVSAHLFGCSGISAVIADDMPKFRQVAEHRGWFAGVDGTMMYKRTD